jgi:tRNA (cmo5U34)-methyltransferase
MQESTKTRGHVTLEEIEDYKRQARATAPRTNKLLPVFAEIALGRASRPDVADPIPDHILLSRDIDTLRFALHVVNYTGIFHRHLNASVPYFGEEQCRLGLAIANYAIHVRNLHERAARLWSFGSAEAPMARAAVRYAEGDLKAHCSSENPENFLDLRARPEAGISIESGPFYDLTHEPFAALSELQPHNVRYDLIFEHTCFQMHHPDRRAPIAIINDRLTDDGILLIYEKLLDPDVDAYQRREKEKDVRFKSKYFSDAEIGLKKDQILGDMERCQAHHGQLMDAINSVARYIVMVWRSGNFMGFAASNSETNLQHFVSLLPQQFVAGDHYGDGLPMSVRGAFNAQPRFKDSCPA